MVSLLKRTFFKTTRGSLKSFGWGTILLTLCSGVTTMHTPHHNDAGQGWLDVKPLFMYTLSTKDLPATPDALATSLSDGFKIGMTLPDGASPVSVKGTKNTDLQSMRIDVSNSRPNLTHKLAKVNDAIPPRDGIFVHQFEILAEPLLLGDAKVLYDLKATDAHLNLFQDEDGRPNLIMVDATTGNVDLTAPLAQIQDFVSDQAKVIAKGTKFLVKNVRFSLESESAHSVAVSIRVNFTVGVVNLKGKMDVDDDMNATASGLHCVGQGPIGLLVASILGPALKDYDGKTRPLMEFPQRKMKLRDVRINVDQSLHINANFGSPVDAVK